MLLEIESFLTDQLGPFGPVIAIGTVGFLLILMVIPLILRERNDPLAKLGAANKAPDPRADATAGPKLRSRSKAKQLEKYSAFLQPKDAKELSDIRRKLLQAGYRSREAVWFYHFSQMVLGVGGLILGVIYFFVAVKNDQTTLQQTLMYTLGPGAVGYMLPNYWITRRVEARKQEIQDGFPDALDMMLVCIEAGQSLDQAILRVSKEIRVAFPSLADEFEIVSHEMKAGKDKAQVLRDMGDRAGVQDVSSFVTVMIQSATFGTSIGEALRVYAAEMRDKRVMRAEEKANKLPTKMTLVTMGLTVPPLLIILTGPSVVSIQALGQLAN